ncbi:MAG: rhamnulokinase family protein [Faecalibacterium sp.]
MKELKTLYTVLAFDFGASSGRAIVASYAPNEAKPLQYKEVHRFENNPRMMGQNFCWDFDALLSEVKIGIAKAGKFDSIGFDTWGVDFGLLDENGNLLAQPVNYRDARTEGMLEKAFEKISLNRLYAYTGNQVMTINTLFQMLGLENQQPELLAKAKKLLFIPDLFAYQLCGNAVCEDSIASTSQMLNPVTKEWSTPVLDTFGISPDLFGERVSSGTVIGTMPCEDGTASVISVAGHDTQCAVAALPTNAANVAFLSCGTWSLLGTELEKPLLTEQSNALNLSNEIGANGKINYLKNIIGLWIIQECRRIWTSEGTKYSYSELEQMALEAAPLTSFIDPDAPEFAVPGNMPTLIQEFCRRTNQVVPETVGEITRCIYESLALKYHFAMQQIATITGTPFTALHILGGGTQSKLLCQFTASAIGMPVFAGPIEATALGNIIIQLKALEALPDIATGRTLIAQTEEILLYSPSDQDAWTRAFAFYKTILTKE